MKKVVGIIAVVGMMFIASCETGGPKPCSEEKGAAAVVMEFPDSVKVGTVHPVDIQFVLENSCGAFERFDVTNTDKTYDVQLITKYEGCSCALELSEEHTSFEIDIDYPGLYEFRFWQADQEYDTRIVRLY